MKNGLIIPILALLLIPGCKTWQWGDTITYHIPEGKHSDSGMPMVIDGTEKWGGYMHMVYNPELMADPAENFAYWNKIGGIMPDITSNLIEGKHQSARVAWRVDPEDPGYIYIGYIVYVKGQDAPERGYLLDDEGEKVRVFVGDEFYSSVTNHGSHWGVYVEYGGKKAAIRVDDERLKKEKFYVVMDPYYGGNPVAPTDIFITVTHIDTNWNY